VELFLSTSGYSESDFERDSFTQCVGSGNTDGQFSNPNGSRNSASGS
jgi:hypothetical protein